MTHLQSCPARRDSCRLSPLLHYWPQPVAAALCEPRSNNRRRWRILSSRPLAASRDPTDDLGIPWHRSQTDDDLFFAMGYVSARDRLGQMLGLRAATQGDLAEQAGETALGPICICDRSILSGRPISCGRMPSATRQTLQRYADGVNAYLDQQQLPADVKLAGFRPELWKPTDSLSISAIVSFILAQNVREEIAFHGLAQQVGVKRPPG